VRAPYWVRAQPTPYIPQANARRLLQSHAKLRVSTISVDASPDKTLYFNEQFNGSMIFT
jgi:hypothetical protein